MFKTLLARARQGYRTAGFPAQEPVMPALFRGRPELAAVGDVAALARSAERCPTGALTVSDAGAAIDLGRCIFCTDCVAGDAGGRDLGGRGCSRRRGALKPGTLARKFYFFASPISLTSSSGRAPRILSPFVVKLVGVARTPIFLPRASHLSTGALQEGAAAGSRPLSMKS